jgi:hypothetical protein
LLEILQFEFELFGRLSLSTTRTRTHCDGTIERTMGQWNLKRRRWKSFGIDLVQRPSKHCNWSVALVPSH